MQDIQTVEYKEYHSEPETPAAPLYRSFPVYRVLFGIQLAAIATVYAAAQGWL